MCGSNNHGLTIWVSFMVNVWGGGSFGSNGFVTNDAAIPMNGYYRTDVISGVGHSRLDSVMPLVLRTVCDECQIMFIWTSLFMFVKPLALLLSKVFACLSVLFSYRSLHSK